MDGCCITAANTLLMILNSPDDGSFNMVALQQQNEQNLAIDELENDVVDALLMIHRSFNHGSSDMVTLQEQNEQYLVTENQIIFE